MRGAEASLRSPDFENPADADPNKLPDKSLQGREIVATRPVVGLAR